MHIKLCDLNFGHEADPPINARRVGREDGIEAYAASIKEHGLIQALNVRQIGGKWYVSDGNKRLAALRLRAQRGEIPADHDVKCDDSLTDADAEELSVAANFIRAPLHEADTYETFRDLQERGSTTDQIAARFGIEVARVKRMLALGSLSPVILDAWRNDKFPHSTVDCVRAFTLAPSLKEQERVYAKLAKSGNLYPNHIRAEFGAGDHAISHHLKTVGLEAYVAAGGRVVEDLFGTNHVILDKPLLAKLASERLVAEIKALEAEGWSWAVLSDNLPSNWAYSWDELRPKVKATKAETQRLVDLQEIYEEAEEGSPEELAAMAEKTKLEDAIAAKGWSEEQKSMAGAVVVLAYDGTVKIRRGMVRPSTAKKAASSSAAGAKENSVPLISNALMHRVSVQATKAVQAAVMQQPRLGLVALLAGFLSGQHNGPIKVSHHGLGQVSQDYQRHEKNEPFADAFARLSAMEVDDLMRIAAGIAGQAVDLQCHSNGYRPFDRGADVLTAAIEPSIMTTALKQHFDPGDYFGSVAKSFIVTAIREAINEDEARKADKLKKAELFDYAVKNVPPTGWLPPELRTASYAGPGAA